MLLWKPANTRDTTLAMQMAIREYPGEVDATQLHYYVTSKDIAAELGKKVEEIGREDRHELLKELGLDPSREVYDILIREEGATGYFVPEGALERAGIALSAWDRGNRTGRLPTRKSGRQENVPHGR